MYKNILIAIDPSHGHDQQHALDLAGQLADGSGAKFTALNAVEPIPAPVAAQVPENLVEMANKEAMADLQRIFEGREEVTCVVRHGKPGSVIVDYAKDNGVDCIVLQSHHPGLSDYFLGSTAARVVRHAHCSVHVMR